MKQNKLIISLLTIGMALVVTPIFSIREKANTGGVFICEDTGEKGPIFYPADYATDITGEPYYSTQNSYTFSSMNFSNTPTEYRGDSVKVAVIDSGLNYTHEDFIDSNSNQIIQGHSRTIDNSSGSWLYYQFSSGYQTKISDTLGHGTNVASVIASQINALGCAGIAPNVDLYVYKVTNTSNGYEWTAINSALQYCYDEGMDVINMSFQAYEHAVSYNGSSMSASTGCSSVMTSYINKCYNAGITLVAAAGNFNTSEPSYPASNNHVISVGSLAESSTDTKAGYSNTYGIDLVAPGTVYVADKGTTSSYKKTQGTSFSAPIVTAAIALYKQAHPSATPSEIEAALYGSCDEINGNPSWSGNGRLNIDRFLGLDEQAFLNVTSSKSLTLNKNATSQIVASTGPNNEITYTSSNSSVATVSNTGLITAVKGGNATITVYGNGLTETISVTVNHTLESISISGQKTTYNVGDTFVKPTVTAHYDDGTTSNVTNSASFSGNDLSSAGTKTVTVSYSGKSTTYQITVSTALPSETLIITRNSFSTSGGYAWYDWEEDDISGKGELYTTETASMQFNKNKGNKVAALYNIAAIPGSITQISAKTASGTERSWKAYVSSTAYSSSGATLTPGSNSTCLNSSGTTVLTSETSLGTSSAGYSFFCIQEVDTSASYLAEIKITYTPKSISGISIKTHPTKTVYESGDVFDPTGLVITATYSDSTTSDIDYASHSTDFSFAPILSTELTTSDTEVTISYKNQVTTQSITVNQAVTLESISVLGQKATFVEGDDFSLGEGVVTAEYSDGSHFDVTSSVTCTGYDKDLVGNQMITVSYTYKKITETVQYQVTVSQGTLSSISVTGQTTVYSKNQVFSFDGVCTATFANGYQRVVTPTSVSSPDMNTGGNKTITISYTYGDITKTTTYEITVNAYRTVMEEQINETEIGSVTYPNNTETKVGVTTSTSGYTSKESNSIRLGSGSNTGTLTVTSSSANIKKVVVSAKSYGSDTQVHLSIGGSDNVITSSFSNYIKEYDTAVSSVAIATTANSKRAYVQSVIVYSVTTTSTDIGQSDDCVGLETFINTYMHMDYTSNLGYCKDETHHYYSSAKAAFNGLNDHQRQLFVNNSAYSNEWARLSTWASKNNESLNTTTNKLGSNDKTMSVMKNNMPSTIIIITTCLSLFAVCGLLVFKKKKEN